MLNKTKQKIKNFIFKTPIYYLLPFTYLIDIGLLCLVWKIGIDIAKIEGIVIGLALIFAGMMAVAGIQSSNRLYFAKREMKEKYKNELLKYQMQDFFKNEEETKYTDVVKEINKG